MNNDHSDATNKGPYDDVTIVSVESLNRIVASLTAAQGYTQLLKRRLDRGGEVDLVQMSQLLAQIENATRSMGNELRMVLHEASRQRQTRNGNGQDA